MTHTFPQEHQVVSSAFRRHDFSSARAFLVPSVPGTHTGNDVNKYGHMRVRSLLQQVSDL